ncbi:MAG: cyanophycinase [Oceanicaulis sp.]
MTSLLLASAGALALTAAAAAEPGTLVIAGGALSDDNAAVFEAFIEAAGGPDARFAILPTASGYPSGSAQSFADALASYGVDPSNIARVELAVMDDPDTDDIDESGWAGAADDAREIAKIEAAGGIWFTGGDQARIGQALIEADGADTPMLEALRARLAGGAVIGGTSAGAAMMSPVMIARGEPMTALLEAPIGLADGAEAPDTDALVLARGLGFFPYGVTDQHFGERARLGRLARAVVTVAEELRVGFGVDENTAMVVDLETHRLEVLGPGHVTMVDARAARAAEADGAARIEGLVLHLLSDGDVLNLETGELALPDFKAATVGDEYYDQAVVSGGGMAVAGDTLADVLGDALLDTASSSETERVSFTGERGVVYRFTQTPDSAGYWGRDARGEGRFTASGVRFDIEPVRLTVTPLIEEAGR